MPTKEIIDYFGREVNYLSGKEFEKKLLQAFHYWRNKDFPYQTPKNLNIMNEYEKLLRSQLEIENNVIGYSTVGLNLVNSFHPHIWHVPSQGHLRSPVDHFGEDETLKKILRKAVTLRSNRRCWSPYNIRSLFGIYAGGRIANFRPTVAKTLINEFSSENDIIIDPCAGYGGRMLGAIIILELMHLNFNIMVLKI